MPAYNGSLVLIKIGDGGGPEIFSTIGGLRTSRLTLGNQTLDTSHAESGVWRQLLNNAGIRSLTISGSGLFTDVATEETLRGYAFAGTVNNYRFVFANGDYVTGPFLITSYERSGSNGNEEIYSLSLASAGTLVFTAA